MWKYLSNQKKAYPVHLFQEQFGTISPKVFRQDRVSLSLWCGWHLRTEKAAVQRFCHQRQTKSWRPAVVKTNYILSITEGRQKEKLHFGKLH